MTNTIASILEAGDIEALHRYAQTPSAKTLDDAPGMWSWPHAPTAELGAVVARLMDDFYGCSNFVNALRFSAMRIMHCNDVTIEHIHVLHALVLHAHQHTTSFTRDDAWGLFSTVRQMNHTGTALCLDKDGLVDHFGDLYALLAAVLPRAEAKEHLLQQARRLDLTLDDVATFLITYGAEAFHDTADLVRAGQQRANFDHLCNAEERFVAMMLTASAHQHLAFVSALDLAAFRNRSACSILGHLTDAAHAPA